MALGLLASACGGSGSSSSSNPPPTNANPCASAAVEEEDQADVSLEDQAAARLLKTHILDGSPRWRVLDALWTHRQYADRAEPRSPGGRRGLSSRANVDAGEIAISRSTPGYRFDPAPATCAVPTTQAPPADEAVDPKASSALVDPYWLEERRKEGLEGTPWWQAKVLGQFPDTQSNAVIPLQWIELARVREPYTDAREWAGLDVARFGSDDSVLVEGNGNAPESVTIIHGQDTMAVAGMGASFLQRRRGALAVDVIGVGAGVVDRIREQRLPGRLLDVNVADAPLRDPELLLNLRAQLWWDVRQQLDPQNSELSLARLDESHYQRLRAELTAPTYRMTSSGKVQIESKEEMKARGLPSPDKPSTRC